MYRPTLADRNQPPIPLILRGKKKSNKTKNNNTSLSTPQGVRLSLDQNLHQIFSAIRSKKRTISIHGYENHLENRPVPILNPNLVRDYINLIYKQYSIKDPLGNHSINQNYQIQPITQRKKDLSVINETITDRKAVHLKQNFLMEMVSFEEDTQSYSPIRRRQTNSEQVRSAQISSSMKFQSRHYKQEIAQSYRYCFICEEPILQANIQLHERNKCPQFSNLYQMSLPQLKQILLRKISGMRQRIRKQLEKGSSMGNDSIKNIFQLLFKQTHTYLRAIDMNVIVKQKNMGLNSLNSDHIKLLDERAEVRNRFNTVIDVFQTDYFTLHAEIRKLQWFTNKYGSFLNESPPRNSFNTISNNRYVDRRFSLAH